MSQPQVYIWPASSQNLEAIAQTQDVTAGENLVLNNSIAAQGGSLFAQNNTIFNTFNNPFVRNLSLSSGDDLSGSIITINGLGSPVGADFNPTQCPNTPISETITGPNVDVIFSENIYSSITSISVSKDVTNLAVGFGDYGITAFCFPDVDRKGWYASASVQVLTATGDAEDLEYTIYGTLNKFNTAAYQGNFIPFPVPIPSYALTTTETTSTIVQIPYPVTSVWMTVSNNVVTSDQTAIFTFLQQGVS